MGLLEDWRGVWLVRTHTHWTTLCPGLPGWASTRKVKPVWILLKHGTVSGSGISWTMCKSAPHSRQITTPAPHHSVFYRPDALPAAQPTASKHWRQSVWPVRSYPQMFSFGTTRARLLFRARFTWKMFIIALCVYVWQGFRKLPVDVQIRLAQESVYPVTLIFHSKYFNLDTGEYNWFINTPQERDLVLGILPPFAALGSHFSSTGFALKSLALSDVEMAFLAAMAVLTATGR